MLRPLPTDMERESESVLAEDSTGALERFRMPPSRKDELEKEGWRAAEYVCTEMLEVMMAVMDQRGWLYHSMSGNWKIVNMAELGTTYINLHCNKYFSIFLYVRYIHTYKFTLNKLYIPKV